jgi:hypothetical protein
MRSSLHDVGSSEEHGNSEQVFNSRSMKLHKLIPLLQHWKMLRKKAEQLKIDMIS